jgi:deazaflavin-dependent oxidoreductase (nitroreductase family)
MVTSSAACGQAAGRDAPQAHSVGFVPNAKDTMAKAATSFHETVFRLSKGRVAGRLYGMPVLILATTGRKSGKRRTTMLTSPIQEDGRVVLVASYGGDDRHPTWFLNLRDNPEVEVTMGGHSRPMRARVASPEEKSQLWPRVVEQYRGYGQYQTKTDRDIPLVILESAKA